MLCVVIYILVAKIPDLLNLADLVNLNAVEAQNCRNLLNFKNLANPFLQAKCLSYLSKQFTLNSGNAPFKKSFNNLITEFFLFFLFFLML